MLWVLIKDPQQGYDICFQGEINKNIMWISSFIWNYV